MYNKMEEFNVNGLLINIINFISSPVVSTILLLTFFLGLTYQLFSHKINFVGVLSIFSIFTFYLGHILVNESSVFALLLLLVASALIVLEFFIFGLVLGVIGTILLFISIIFITNDPMLYSVIVFLIIILVAIEVGVLVKMKKKRVPLWKRFVLTDATDSESGYTSFDDRSYLLGKVGVTAVPLRPSGTVIIDDNRIDAVAEGTFIERDVKVKVVFVEGTRIVVRPIKNEEVDN